MRLSAHFTLAEAVKSQTAVRLGIDNTPPAVVIEATKAVAEHILEPVRAHYGIPIIPTSWFRCPKLNRLIGGKQNSQHVRGEAVDFEVAGVPNVDVARWISNNLEYDQVILEFYDGINPNSGWVHVSYAEHLRRMALTFDGKNYRAGIPA
jgi:hypothetical protein